MPTSLFFPAAIEIDGSPLTDQGRAPISVTREERSTIVELASGGRKRYIKAVKHKFDMSWVWLPDTSDGTIDGGLGRQKLQQLVGESISTHTLRMYDRNAGWQEYSVFVESYIEVLKRRDATTGTHFWDVTASFLEV